MYGRPNWQHKRASLVILNNSIMTPPGSVRHRLNNSRNGTTLIVPQRTLDPLMRFSTSFSNKNNFSMFALGGVYLKVQHSIRFFLCRSIKPRAKNTKFIRQRRTTLASKRNNYAVSQNVMFCCWDNIKRNNQMFPN